MNVCRDGWRNAASSPYLELSPERTQPRGVCVCECVCVGDQQAIFNAPTNVSASNDAVEVTTFHMKTQAAGQA